MDFDNGKKIYCSVWEFGVTGYMNVDGDHDFLIEECDYGYLRNDTFHMMLGGMGVDTVVVWLFADGGGNLLMEWEIQVGCIDLFSNLIETINRLSRTARYCKTFDSKGKTPNELYKDVFGCDLREDNEF